MGASRPIEGKAVHDRIRYLLLRALDPEYFRDKTRRAARTFRQTHRIAVYAYGHWRRSYRREMGSYSEQEWTELKAKYCNRCLCCGEVKPLTVDHVVPLSKGGSNLIENIQPLCKPCNSAKGTQIIDYRVCCEVIVQAMKGGLPEIACPANPAV
jgi:5-methylcytosine-specific restriction endonuclease McrA